MLFLFASPFVNAKDLGTYGTTFPIQEEDLIQVLQNRLSNAQYDEEKKMVIENAWLESIHNPKGIKLPKAIKPRIFEYDPTIVVQEDIKDADETIIIPKGTKINPLDRTGLGRSLLLFDANDPSQIKWAKTKDGLWILLQGKPIELEEREGREVYFDQDGYLSKKLGVRALPAIVSQKNKKLIIEEVPCF